MPENTEDSDQTGVSQLSATTPEDPTVVKKIRRRLPQLVDGFSINFCRNTLCDLFGEYPDEYDQRGRHKANKARSNISNGKVIGSGNDRSYQCPSCLGFNVLKSNIAVVEEYRRLLSIYTRTKQVHCPKVGCENFGNGVSTYETRYRRYGQTAKGDPRFQCKSCRTVFSVGKSNRRHKRKDLARKVLRSLVNGMTLTAISEVQGVHIEDVYRKIDFIHEQCLEFAKDRERELPACFEGKRPNVAMDTQVLMLNWSDKGVRKQVDIRHNCTVERDTGFVIAATTDVDPDITPFVEEELAELRGERKVPKSMRENGRIWFATDYLNYIRRRHDSLRLEPHEEARGVTDESLLMRCGRVYQDIADYAHIMLVKSKIGSQYEHLNVSTDRDAGLSQAYCAIFKDEIQEKKITVADVTFDQGRTNDYRRALVAQGRRYLEDVQGLMAVNPEQVVVMPDEVMLVERAMAFLLAGLRKQYHPETFKSGLMAGIDYPFHFLNEPNKRVIFRTDPNVLTTAQLATFIVKAGTNRVDTYHARGRYKVMGFERGLSSSGSKGLYFYKQYYDPVRVFKIANILRFAHNYMDLMRAKESPAMKLGLSKGFIYDRDLV